MCQDCRNVFLGFTEDQVPAGTHMCLIYTSEKERRDSLFSFLLRGLQDGERAACFAAELRETELEAFLARHGVSLDEAKDSGALSLAGTSEIYFRDNRFDPELMLNNLQEFYESAMAGGYTAARVIGEMVPEIEQIAGGDRLLEYESRVTLLLRDYPVTSVCQYDAKAFDGATIMEIFKVHPQMIVNGSVINNPFYIDPETYLGPH